MCVRLAARKRVSKNAWIVRRKARMMSTLMHLVDGLTRKLSGFFRRNAPCVWDQFSSAFKAHGWGAWIVACFCIVGATFGGFPLCAASSSHHGSTHSQKGSSDANVGFGQHSPQSVAETNWGVGALGFIEPRSGVVQAAFSNADDVVQDVCVQRGDKVTKGQILARTQRYETQSLNVTIWAHKVQMAQAQWRTARLRRAHAQRELKRYLLVRKAQAGTPGRQDELEVALAAAVYKEAESQAYHHTCQNELNYARTILRHCTLRAPMDGYVLDVAVRAGEKASEKILLADLEHLEIVAEVHEHDIGRIAVGQTVVVHVPNETSVGGVKREGPASFQAKVTFKGFHVKSNSLADTDPRGPQDLRIIEVRAALRPQDVVYFRHSIHRQVHLQFLPVQR